MTAKAEPAGAPARAPRRPWGTFLLIVSSGLILLAQALSQADWSGPWLLSPDNVRVPSALTYAFFHADLLHWGVNMAFLLLVAPRLERGIGGPAVVGLFLAGAFVAGLLHVSMVTLFAASRQSQPLLGASGGVMSLLGAYAVRYYNQPFWPGWIARMPSLARRFMPPFDLFNRKTASFVLPVGWVLFAALVSEAVFGWQEIVALDGGVAHWAHVGGFLAGMAISALSGLHRAGRREEAVSQATLDAQALSLSAYLRDNPGDVDSRVAYAAVLVRLGDSERARKAYVRALEDYLAADRRRAAAVTYLALLQAGLETTGPALEMKAALALEDAGFIDEALAAYDRLCSTPGPEAESAGLRAARLAERQNRPEDAFRRYNAFLLMFPHSPFEPFVRRSLDRVRERWPRAPQA